MHSEHVHTAAAQLDEAVVQREAVFKPPWRWKQMEEVMMFVVILIRFVGMFRLPFTP